MDIEKALYKFARNQKWKDRVNEKDQWDKEYDKKKKTEENQK